MQGVHDIDLNRALDFENALNAVFGSNGTSGLSFQVGARMEDVVTLTFQGIGPNTIKATASANAFVMHNNLLRDIIGTIVRA